MAEEKKTTLEEAAEKYASDYPAYNDEQMIAENAFKAGAEWQKEQMIRDCSVQASYEAEIEKAEERGYNLCKEQMLKEAVEGEISSDGAGRLYAETSLYLEDEMALNEGDKVKIIIVPDKEDKK